MEKTPDPSTPTPPDSARVIPTKSELRRAMLERLRKLSFLERRERSARVCARLALMLDQRALSQVALYQALPDEVSLEPLLERGLPVGVRVFLPVVVDATRLEFRVWQPEVPLVRGRFGILEPPPGAPVTPVESLELIVIPGLAFDARGYRLGRGRGYFDRALSIRSRALRCGVGFEFQCVPRLPEDPWDVRMHLVVDERGVLETGLA